MSDKPQQSTDEHQRKAIWGLFKNYGLALSRGMDAENRLQNQLAADFKQATGEDMPRPDDKRGWLKVAMAHGYPGATAIDTFAIYQYVMLRAGKATPPPKHTGDSPGVTITEARDQCANEGLAVPSKSTWSKAAKKPPGSYGHLPTQQRGRSRYVTVADARRFCRDYEAKAGSKDNGRLIAVSTFQETQKK